MRVTPDLDLEVDAVIAGSGAGLHVDAPAEPFIEDLEVLCRDLCRARYRVRLRDAAVALRDANIALLAGGAVFAPPSTWLLRPAEVPDEGRFRFRVTTPPGVRFETGVRPAAVAGSARYEALASELDRSAFAAFGALRVLRVAPGAEVVIAPALALSDARISAWARSAVTVIGDYFGRASADRVVVFVAPGTSEVTRGVTLNDGGPSVLIRLGRSVTDTTLGEDWVLPHEIIHVAFPDVGRQASWFSEGLASYVEPVARARAGLRTAKQFWTELVEGMPQGLPGPGDTGLKGAWELPDEQRWGRIYWGGALYFLLADIAIRERTSGRKSLRDALVAIAREDGGESYLPVETALRLGDAAIGMAVLRELHDRLALAPGTEDLQGLWHRLGIRGRPPSVEFDDSAPLAAIRSQITAFR